MGYRVVKKAWRYVQPFWYNTSMWRTDRRTDRQTDVQPISITCFSIADARKKTSLYNEHANRHTSHANVNVWNSAGLPENVENCRPTVHKFLFTFKLTKIVGVFLRSRSLSSRLFHTFRTLQWLRPATTRNPVFLIINCRSILRYIRNVLYTFIKIVLQKTRGDQVIMRDRPKSTLNICTYRGIMIGLIW